jgi:hypothetical protein
MNVQKFNAADLFGTVGAATAMTAGDYLAAAAAVVTIAAMAPLAWWRWRAMLRGDPKNAPAPSEVREE